MVIRRVVHRGMVGHLTHAGVWVMEDILPRWGHWSRFWTLPERQLLGDSHGDPLQQEQVIRTGIDRALADNPVWRGDIRDQPN